MSERNRSIVVVYLSACMVGLAWVLFPALGAVFTDPGGYGLTSGQYGFLFTPQIVAAIIASLLSGRIAGRFGMKWVLFGGLAANWAAMLLLGASYWFTSVGNVAYVMLLLASAGLGAGLGWGMGAAMAYAFDLFKTRTNAAVTGVHALAGVGMIGAPMILNLSLQIAGWWAAPLMVLFPLTVLLGCEVRLPLAMSQESSGAANTSEGQPLSQRLWLFLAIAFLYGVLEATFGNWSPIFLNQDQHLSVADTGLALAAFWGMVTVGRVLFMVVSNRIKPQTLYILSPFVVAGSFLLLPSLAGALSNTLGLGIAGFAMSFLFPLSVSLACNEDPARSGYTSGFMMASEMLGAGLGCNAVGLGRASLGLAQVFRLSSLYTVLMLLIIGYLTLRRVTGHSALVSRRLPKSRETREVSPAASM